MKHKVINSPMLKFISSVKLFIFLCVIITFVLVLGTVILQNASPEQYIARYGKVTYTLFRSLKLTNIYHAWWFTALLFLLAINIFTCALKRFSLRLNKAGPTVIHFGIVIILAGAAISAVSSERGFMGLREGESKDVFYIGHNPKKLGFKLYLRDFILEEEDSFHADKLLAQLEDRDIHQALSTNITDFKSKLVIIDNGEIVKTKTIEVNNPLQYKGYTFYQADYNQHDLSWTGISVVKDPGVPLVYTGFCTLIVGLLFTFYGKPFLNKRKKVEK